MRNLSPAMLLICLLFTALGHAAEPNAPKPPQPIEKSITRKVIQEETVQGDRRKKVDGKWLIVHEHVSAPME